MTRRSSSEHSAVSSILDEADGSEEEKQIASASELQLDQALEQAACGRNSLHREAPDQAASRRGSLHSHSSSSPGSRWEKPYVSEDRMHAVLGGLESAQATITEAIQAIQEQLGVPIHNDLIVSTEEQEGSSNVISFPSEFVTTSANACQDPQACRSFFGKAQPPSAPPSRSRSSLRQFGTASFAVRSSDPEILDTGIPDTGGAAGLPEDWPSALCVRKIGKDSQKSLQQSFSNCSKLVRSKTKTGTFVEEPDGDDGSGTKVRNRRQVQCFREPDSAFDRVWKIGGFVMLLYDIIVMPVVLAWDLPFEGTLANIAWTTLAYWFVELVLTFFTGFYEEGLLNMNASAAAHRYLRSWFVPDAVVVLCDLSSMLLLASTDSESTSSMGLRVTRFAKLGRFIRVVGLLRVFRAVRAFEKALEKSCTEMQRTIFRLMVMAVCWLWMNHILACSWYAIGLYAPSDTGARWVERTFLAELEDFHYIHAGLLFQYSTAMHWSIAQTTLGAMEIASVNTAERIFNVGCLLIGLFFGSSLISSLSAGMVEFKMSMRARSQTMTTLHRYLRENNVNERVALLVQRQVAARLSDTARLEAKDVPALEILATGVRCRLHSEICQPHLQKHQLFQLWQHMDSQWFQQFCFKAVELNFLRPEDELFLPGCESVATYFTVSGMMDYEQVPESSPVHVEMKRHVENGVWLAESTLWVHWIHVGRLEAVKWCQVLAIQVEGFTQAMLEHYTIRSVARQYGQSFAESVLSAKPPLLPWPDDLRVPFAEFNDVVVALPTDLHITIGSIAIDYSKNGFIKSWSSSQAQEHLRQEVENGKSIVVLNLAGELERIVALAVLHVVRGDGRVLVQLANLVNSQVVPDMQLPGLKCLRNESADEAVQRLLATRFAPLAGCIEIMSVERQSMNAESARYGLRTLYMRKQYFVRSTTEDFHAPVCSEHVDLANSIKSELATRRVSSVGSTADIFEHVPVYFIRQEMRAVGEPEGAFCAWLRESDVKQLSTLNSSSSVKRWLSSLSPPAPEDSESAAETLQESHV